MTEPSTRVSGQHFQASSEPSTRVPGRHFQASSAWLCASRQCILGVAFIIPGLGCSATNEVAYCLPHSPDVAVCMKPWWSNVIFMDPTTLLSMCTPRCITSLSTSGIVMSFQKWPDIGRSARSWKNTKYRLVSKSPCLICCVCTQAADCNANHRTLVEPCPTAELQAVRRRTSASQENPEISKS